MFKRYELIKVSNTGDMFLITHNITLHDATKKKDMIDHIKECQRKSRKYVVKAKKLCG